ncbi:hypothetical protein GY45DRAFT_46157 [Cubamyces sp. BRFM 1775]|nr:hypothetical protein GY45DRAFT_46157 [Cubamyces sp. BRFM 1775]
MHVPNQTLSSSQSSISAAMIEIPLDVCNLILDALDDICDSDPDWPFWSINEADNRFYSPKYYNQRYRAKSFMACALICSTWHDHALELLYSTVQLETGIQCQLYLETLAAHPERANWARKLALYPKTYIPLLPLLTPGFLPRCSQLQIGLSMGDPSVGYPPHYFSNVLHPLLSRHPGIAVLRLGTSQWITVSRLLRLMGSMPALHTIDFMSSHVGPESMDLATAGVIKSANRTHAREAIVTMSALRPTHDHRRWSMFARAVGPVITQLELSWHLGLAAYRDIGECSVASLTNCWNP